MASISLPLRVAYEGGVDGAGFKGDDLRAASGAVEHPAWEAAHLGVAALAGVLAQGIRQRDYLLEGLQNDALDVAAAGVALGQIGPSSVEPAPHARRANDGARPGRHARWNLHLLLLLPRSWAPHHERKLTVDPPRDGSVIEA